MTVTVELTQVDIKRAADCGFREPYEPVNICCPIAQALRRQFPGKQISVGGLTMKVGDTYFNVSDGDKDRVRRIIVLSRFQWWQCIPITFEIYQ